MTDLFTPGPVTEAVLSMLRTARGSVKVYDMTVPDDATVPYHLLTPIAGGGTSGPPLTSPNADISVVYQVDCVGRQRSEAQYLQGKIWQALVGRGDTGSFDTPIVLPAGRVVADRLPPDAPDGVYRQGTSPQYLYVTQDRFTLLITPSS